MGLFNHNIKAKIITGERIGDEVSIPWITLNTEDTSPFLFTLFRETISNYISFCHNNK